MLGKPSNPLLPFYLAKKLAGPGIIHVVAIIEIIEARFRGLIFITKAARVGNFG